MPNIRHSGWLPTHAASAKICLQYNSHIFPYLPLLPCYYPELRALSQDILPHLLFFNRLHLRSLLLD